MVYVPDIWWHATVSLEDTACIGGQRHKDRLPEEWGRELLERWPGCGLALSAVAQERQDVRLLEEALLSSIV